MLVTNQTLNLAQPREIITSKMVGLTPPLINVKEHSQLSQGIPTEDIILKANLLMKKTLDVRSLPHMIT